MNAAFMSARSRALEAISHFSNGSSSTSLPTTSWRTSSKPKRSFDRPRLFTRNRSDLDASSETPSRSTVLFVLGCLAWYTSSSLSSNTSKSLLSKSRSSSSSLPPAFPYPVTLTLIHFIFVNVIPLFCSPFIRSGFFVQLEALRYELMPIRDRPRGSFVYLFGQ